ncbi:MAG: right-handed parallel beta-helix repeat-containing protein [Verrucomicrobiota bacterium]
MKQFFALAILSIVASSGRSEIFVDAKASPGGDGSASAPFQTISAALTSTGPGPVTVKGGVYREEIKIAKGGKAESPLVLRAAPGEQVTVTGFEPLTNWKDEGGGLFSLQVTERVEDLFVDARRQRLARFPDADQPWIRITGDDKLAGRLELDAVPDVPQDQLKDVYALIFCQAINGEVTYPVTAVDAAAKTVTVSSGERPFLPKTGDALVVLNAASFVNVPGEWNCQPSGDGWKVLFRPEKPDDLARTQTRHRPEVVRIGGEAAGHVTIEGFELTGGSVYGVYASGVSGVRISRCLIYANGSPGRVPGLGLRIDKCTDFTLESCVIFANHINGVGITQGENITVRCCEIAANDGDGIQFTGRNNAPGDPLRKVRLENCFVHHHFYLGHPDNTQIYGYVRDVTYENNVLLLGGQNAMIEQCEDMKFLNNTFFSAVSRHVILGHGNAHHADFRNNTFAFANFSAIGTAAKGVEIRDNIFYGNVLAYESDEVKGDGNLIWPSREEDPVLLHTVPKWKKYLTPQEFAADHGSEANSKRENPQFKNVPLAQAIGRSSFFEGARNTIYLDGKSISDFAASDTIEVNGDGVARRIEKVGENSISFAPPLPILPFRDAIVWKWPNGASLQLDLHAARAGKAGSNLDLAAYQRGELDGSGKRSLPELSATASAAMPSPDVFVYPFSLPTGK